jgi:hypothetical protein
MALKGPLWEYAKWYMSQRLHVAAKPHLPPMPPALQAHAEFAADWLVHSPLEVSGTMRKHQLALADRQCRMAEISRRVQDVIIMLCTSLYAARQQDEVVRAAADLICQDLTRQLNGKRPSDSYFRKVSKLGEQIVDGGFKSIAGLSAGEILMPYEND